MTGVVVIAFALLVWIINPTIHGVSFVVLVVALVAGLACVVLGSCGVHEVDPRLC